MPAPTTDRTQQTQPVTSPNRAPRGSASTTFLPLATKIIALGLLVGVAVSVTPALLLSGSWVFLALLWGAVALLAVTYLSPRLVPLKYLVPGTLLLALFVVVPILITVGLSTTNYGDGARGSKEETIDRLLTQSFERSPGSPTYAMTVATTGSAVDGPFTLLLVEPSSEEVRAGTEDGLTPLPGATVTDGFVTEAEGLEILTPSQVNAAGAALTTLRVPSPDGEVRPVGVSQAYAGSPTLTYDSSADSFTRSTDGAVFTLQPTGDRQFYVNAEGERLSDQSWRDGVGAANYTRIFTDERIRSDFVSIFVWTVVFATLSVVTTFALGLGLAVALNDRRVRGQKIYRALLILPYAIPGFISLLIWANFWNTDFGLINSMTGLDVDWFGNGTTAKIAVVVTNLWMGFPYMFLVSTGALQAIPEDLKEAAAMDGASGWFGFRKITLPLLLVAVAPLLVATFAFNFNNFNAIQLLTEGGPFSPDNPTAGETDILISYTIRLAFGAGGAQIGFASAVSVVLFLITGVIAALQFRATRRLEDVN